MLDDFPLRMEWILSISAYLDPDTATKIQVCSGAGSVGSAVPSKVKTFIDAKSIDVMERRRIAFFAGGNEVPTNKRIAWGSIPL
jgi:hypothetical protein